MRNIIKVLAVSSILAVSVGSAQAFWVVLSGAMVTELAMATFHST